MNRCRRAGSRMQLGRKEFTEGLDWGGKALIFGLLLCAAFLTQGQANSASEYQLKAAFLFNFAKFIDWPQTAFAESKAPFAICVFGKDPFGDSLDQALANKTVGDHPIAIQRTRDKAELRKCHIVFVSASETEHIAEIKESLRGTSVLLVGESGGFAESGGMIEFTLDGGHVRFTINPDAAEEANLKISSKLLALAKIVHNEAHLRGI